MLIFSVRVQTLFTRLNCSDYPLEIPSAEDQRLGTFQTRDHFWLLLLQSPPPLTANYLWQIIWIEHMTNYLI